MTIIERSPTVIHRLEIEDMEQHWNCLKALKC